MEITEDEKIEKHVKQCRHCLRITLLPYEFEFICIACGYNSIKRKNELSKIQRRENIFFGRLNNP